MKWGTEVVVKHVIMEDNLLDNFLFFELGVMCTLALAPLSSSEVHAHS